MELVVSVSTVVALLSFSALCLYAIAMLRDLRTLAQTLQQQLQGLQQLLSILPSTLQSVQTRLLSTIHYVEESAKNTARLTAQLHEQMQGASGIFHEVEALKLQIRRVRTFVDDNILSPAQSIASFLSALIKGLTVFLQALTPTTPQYKQTERTPLQESELRTPK